MYKYIPLIADMKEMMVMMNSLPMCTVIFDRNAGLVDMNFLAEKLLKVDNKEDYINNKLRIVTNYPYLHNLINELKKGNIISKVNLCFLSANGDNVYVECNATVLYGSRKIFLFQFYETVPALDAPTYVSPKCTQPDIQISNSIEILSKKKSITGINRATYINNLFLNDNTIKLLSAVHPNLTISEILQCRLITEDKSIIEIACILQETQSRIHSQIRSIRYKLGFKSYEKMVEHLKIVTG